MTDNMQFAELFKPYESKAMDHFLKPPVLQMNVRSIKKTNGKQSYLK